MDELFVHKGKPVAIHELYEHALNHIEMFPPEARCAIKENIASLKWIDEKFDKNSVAMYILILDMANKIHCHEDFSFDLMSLSATVYKGRERDVDVQPLIDAMNANGKWLILRQTEKMKDEYLTHLN